jgi:hypothetical protein
MNDIEIIDVVTDDQFFDDFFDRLDDSNDLIEIIDIEVNNSPEEEPFKYVKKPFMTWTEKSFYNKLVKVFGDKYIIQPQINLASIMNKEGSFEYANELFRNIDFGIFSKDTYQLLLLIELNDESHLKLNRQVRDIKVEKLCKKAGYHLIKFWTNQPNRLFYIDYRINKNLIK